MNVGAAPSNATVPGCPPTVTVTFWTSHFSVDPEMEPVTPAGLVCPPPVKYSVT